MLLTYILIIGVIILLVVDCLTTLDIKNHPDMYETNLILGPHPSDSKILVYFAICNIIFCMVALALSDTIQYIWIGAWAIVEIRYIINNLKLGLKP